VREDDHGALHPPGAGADRRRDPVPARRREHGPPGNPAEATPPAPAPRDADDLPGSVLVPEPQEDAARDRRRAAPGPRRGGPQGAGGPRRGPAPDGGAPAGVPSPLPARVQRRPAAADRHRPRARAEPEPRGRRRARLRARRLGAGADPEPDARPPGRAGAHLPVRRPRPLGGQARQRPGGGDVCRPDRRGRRDGAAVPRPAPSVHRGAPVGGAEAGSPPPLAAHRPGGRCRRPRQPPAGLLLPPPLPLRDTRLPGRGPATRRDRARPLGGLSPGAGAHAARRRRLSARHAPRAGGPGAGREGAGGRAAGASGPGGRLVAPRPRVVLRCPVPADAAALLGLVRASRGLHRPWVYPAATPAGIAGWIAGAAAAGRRSFLVCRRGDGGIVGVVNVSEIVRGHFRSAYLGYYAFAPHAGQGYMTEGLGLVLREAFTRLRLHRVEANIQPGNRRSLALVRRLGFRREGFSPRYLEVGGRWRDHERWALLREEW